MEILIKDCDNHLLRLPLLCALITPQPLHYHDSHIVTSTPSTHVLLASPHTPHSLVCGPFYSHACLHGRATNITCVTHAIVAQYTTFVVMFVTSSSFSSPSRPQCPSLRYVGRGPHVLPVPSPPLFIFFLFKLFVAPPLVVHFAEVAAVACLLNATIMGISLRSP